MSEKTIQQQDKALKTLNPAKIWLPVIIGLAGVVLLFYLDDSVTLDQLWLISDASIGAILLTIAVIFFRDFFYTWRIRELTNKELTWQASLFTILLWEFSSAVTPSVVGGTAVAVFILYREGLPLGKALAYVMLTAILDNMFFLVISPVVMLFTDEAIFPSLTQTIMGRTLPLKSLFLVSYGLIFIYTAIMALALFWRPRYFKFLLVRLFSIKALRKWRYAAAQQGEEIILASRHIRNGSKSYWFKISFATLVIWSSRYLIVNSLVEAYVDLNIGEHLMVWSRHLVMWITALVSPTPGASGTSEYFFKQFFDAYLGGYITPTLVTWRFLTYYLYLFVGALILPRWLRRTFKAIGPPKKRGSEENQAQKKD